MSTEIINQIPYISGRHGPRLAIGILTRSTHEIFSYSAYSHFVQAAYARHRNYAMLPLLPDSNIIDYEYHRKLVPILHALNRTDMAFHCDYLVWIDADAIFLDFSFRIEELASQYPNAHIIMSADVSMSGNTGVMIIRNSRWSVKFLRDWLAQRIVSRDFTDQAGLQYLLRIRSDTKNKLVLVPPNALNSDAPAMGRQNPEDVILHLAAESNVYRQDVLSVAADAICRATEQQHYKKVKFDCPRREKTYHHSQGFLSDQLGLHRECLQYIGVHSYRNISKDLLYQIVQKPDDVTIQELRELRVTVSKYCHAIKYSNNENETLETIYLRKSLHRLLMYLSRRLRYSSTCKMIDSYGFNEGSDILPVHILEEIRLADELDSMLPTTQEKSIELAGCGHLIRLRVTDLSEVLKLSCEISYEYFQSLRAIDSMQPSMHDVLFIDDGLFSHFPQIFQIDRENARGDVFDVFELRLRISTFILSQIVELEKLTQSTQRNLIYDLRASLLSDIGLIRLEQGFLGDALVLFEDSNRLYQKLEEEWSAAFVDKRASFSAMSLYGGALCLNKTFDLGINFITRAINLEENHVGSHHHNLISKLTNVALCYFEKYKDIEENYPRSFSGEGGIFKLESIHIEILEKSRSFALRALDNINHNKGIPNVQHIKYTIENHLLKLSSFFIP